MKEKLIKKLDGRTMTWFWSKYIHKDCGIMYTTFMNQLDGRGRMSDKVKKAVCDFIGEDDAD